jgi:toxin ParE1/3/4
MNIRIHPLASQEIETHAVWYERRRDGLGDRFVSDVMHALELIARVPTTWPFWPLASTRRAGIRHRSLRSFPISVAYLVAPDGSPFVIAVAHTSRRPAYWLDRLR